MNDSQFGRIALIGFGEAGQAFAQGLANAAGILSAYDVKSDDPAQKAGIDAIYKSSGVSGFAAPQGALSGATLVFCLVPADQSRIAARAAAPFLPRGALWLDGTSTAPESKREAAAVIQNAGGRYVDVAIMAPVHPRLHRTPVLLAGEFAPSARTALQALGMEAPIAGANVGDASAIKMIRSIMVKGIEALTAECFLAARVAGVQEAVLASLRSSDGAVDWQVRGSYNIDRMIEHGARRAAEMREVVETLTHLGLPSAMASASAEWQDRVAALKLETREGSLDQKLDDVLTALR